MKVFIKNYTSKAYFIHQQLTFVNQLQLHYHFDCSFPKRYYSYFLWHPLSQILLRMQCSLVKD